MQVRNTAWLAETAIYVATVDKLSDVLKAILDWVKENRGQVGQIKKINADCILHAALQDDKEQVTVHMKFIKYVNNTVPVPGPHPLQQWVQIRSRQHPESEQGLPEEDKAVPGKS